MQNTYILRYEYIKAAVLSSRAGCDTTYPTTPNNDTAWFTVQVLMFLMIRLSLLEAPIHKCLSYSVRSEARRELDVRQAWCDAS